MTWLLTTKLGHALIGVLAVVMAVAASGLYFHHTGYASGVSVGNAKVVALTAQYAEVEAKAEADARAQEQAAAVAMTQIQQTYYQQGVTDANAKSDAVIAGMRTGTLRLREQWRGCEAAASVPATGGSASQPDADAQLRSQGAGDLVRYAVEADAQIRALQAVVKADRQ